MPSAARRAINPVWRLFDIVGAALADGEPERIGITIYDADATPIAWGGRVSDVPKERIEGPATLIVAPGAHGPGLIRIEPIPAASGAPRVATVVVEQTLGELQGAPGLNDTFLLPTSLVPVRVRARIGASAEPDRLPSPCRPGGGVCSSGGAARRL